MLAFIFQLVFGIVRTINVQHIAKDNLLASVLSGTGVAILWVLSTRAGIDAFNADNPWGIVGYIAGAALSVLIAMRHKIIVKHIRRYIVAINIRLNATVKLTVVETNNKGLSRPWAYCICFKGESQYFSTSITPSKETAISAFIQKYFAIKNL